MKVLYPKALWVFAVAAIALVFVQALNYVLFLQNTKTSVASFLFSTIVAAALFFACSASLAFFESSVLQRFLVMSAAVIIFLGVPDLIEGPNPWDFFAAVSFSFIFGVTGFATIVIAAVSAKLALGASRVDAPEEDETYLSHH